MEENILQSLDKEHIPAVFINSVYHKLYPDIALIFLNGFMLPLPLPLLLLPTRLSAIIATIYVSMSG